MKIAVFEWLCGGGLHGLATSDVPSAMLQEGWAMLSTLVQQLSSADHELFTMIDGRLVTSTQLASLPPVRLERFEVASEVVSVSSSDSEAARTIEAWMSCALNSKVDLVTVVAPEIDGVLQQAIAAFRASGLPVLNCIGPFLDRACDKWLTAQHLNKANLSHPSTRLASNIDDLFDTHASRWCVKSRLGAGCEDMWVGEFQNLRPKIKTLDDPSRYIVQPWLEGQAYSCSAIVGAHGKAIWLPLVTQSFEPIPIEGDSHGLSYRGGKLIDPRTEPERPIELLNNLLPALSDGAKEAIGWIGVDLLLRPTGQWAIIEVNPRLTTSIIGLARAAPLNLAEVMIAAFQGDEILAPSSDGWRTVEFAV